MLYNQDVRGPVMLPAALLYGIGFSLAGQQLGKRDYQRQVRYGLGLRYSITSVAASLIVVIFWRPDYWWMVASYGLMALAIFIVNGLIAKNGIKGMPKGRIFK